MQFHAAHTRNICLDWICNSYTPLSEDTGACFVEHRGHLNTDWGRESQLVKQLASHLGWLSHTPGIGATETQPLLSTAARYCQGEAPQGQDARLQQLFCPLCPELMQQTVLLFTFFLKSFLYNSIFFLFEHQETLSLWFVWLFFLFCFVGGGILRQGLIAKNDFGLLLLLPLPPEQRNATVCHHASFMWYMGQNSGLSTF